MQIAFIGVIMPNGNVRGSWVKDGKGNLRNLISRFVNEVNPDSFVGLGYCFGIYGKRDAKAFVKMLESNMLLGMYKETEILKGKLFAYTDLSMDAKYVFADVKDLVRQQINYAYLFDKKTKQWKTYEGKGVSLSYNIDELMAKATTEDLVRVGQVYYADALKGAKAASTQYAKESFVRNLESYLGLRKIGFDPKKNNAEINKKLIDLYRRQDGLRGFEEHFETKGLTINNPHFIAFTIQNAKFNLVLECLGTKYTELYKRIHNYPELCEELKPYKEIVDAYAVCRKDSYTEEEFDRYFTVHTLDTSYLKEDKHLKAMLINLFYREDKLKAYYEFVVKHKVSDYETTKERR